MHFMVSFNVPRSTRRPRRIHARPAAPHLSGISWSAGFTLLELLMVITILSAVAWMALGNVADNTSQVRYEDTRNRLIAIRKAVIGSMDTSLLERDIQIGFIVDNGCLPPDLKALTTTPDYFYSYGEVSPVFDKTLASVPGINDGTDEVILSEPKDQLMKGHRGYYLVGSRNGEFRDGWGTNRTSSGAENITCPALSSIITDGASKGNDKDSKNFGWCVTLTGASQAYWKHKDFHLHSYGMDGQKDKLTGDVYEEDISSDPVLADDWQVNLQGSTVTVTNNSSSNISATTYKVSLLVYVSDANNDSTKNEYHWVRFDSDDGTGALVAGTTYTLSFVSSARVPIGEHLLVLIVDDTPYDTDAGTTGIQSISARVKFYSRVSAPTMLAELQIP